MLPLFILEREEENFPPKKKTFRNPNGTPAEREFETAASRATNGKAGKLVLSTVSFT